MSRPTQYASYKDLAPKDNTPKYNCISIQDHHHRKNILAENHIVCIYLHADWCEPCKTVSPLFSSTAQQYNNIGHCFLLKENVELKLTRDIEITGIPAFIFYVKGQLLRNKDGSPVNVVGGDINKVKQILDNLIGPKSV